MVKILLMYCAFLILTGNFVNVYASSLTVPQGSSFNINSGELDGIGDITNNGTIQLTDGSITMSGDWANNGTFTPGTGAVTFEGSQNSSISGDTTFYDFTCETPNKQLTFEAGSTQTISNSLNLNGQALGTEIVLRSATEGNRWDFDNTAEKQDVYYLDVKDSNVTSNNIHAHDSINSGNNDDNESIPHWIFGDIVINNIFTPPSQSAQTSVYEDETVTYEVDATGPSENMEYQFKLEERIVQDFSSDESCDFTPQAGELARNTFSVFVEDDDGREMSDDFDVFIFHRPDEP